MLQIRRGNRDNFKIISLMRLNKNIFCDPSLEPSCRDGSNEGSQHMFLLKNKKNYPPLSGGCSAYDMTGKGIKCGK